MNQSELENKIQLETDKYVHDLENRFGQSEFKNTVIKFLKSKPHRFLLLESPDTSASAWKLLQVLKELQGVPDLTVFNVYLESQNQTILQWGQLYDVSQWSQEVPNFKNLLVCEIIDSMRLLLNDYQLIRTILKRLSFAIEKKVIFIISSKHNAYFKEVKSDSSIYFNESENKTMLFYDIGSKSLTERISTGDVSAVEELLDSSADVNGTGFNGITALHTAAFSGRIDLTLSLLKNGAHHLPDETGNTPLHYAAEQGHEDVVKVILENNIDVNIKGSNGQTALHHAARCGRKDLVLTLLKHEAKHLPDENKDTPLHYAVKRGHVDVVKLFLENNVDINVKGSNDQTALHYAAQSGGKDLVLTLLKHGAKHLPDQNQDTPLHYAAEKGHEDVVILILKNYIDVNIKGSTEQTALHYAAKSGHKDLVLTLLRHGANHLPNKDKDTPFHYAAINGHEDIVKLFLENNVDVNIKGCQKETALHYAAYYGHTNLLLTLLKHGAKHSPNIIKETPLHYAALNGHKDIVELFLKNDVDINNKGFFERTALHYAAESGHKDLVSTMLKHGAKHLPDGEKGTPLHYAARWGHEDVVKLFLEIDIDVNIKKSNEETALHDAAYDGHIDLVSTLLKRGAKHLPNKDKDTPLHYAARWGHEDVVKLFLQSEVDVNIKGSVEQTALHYAAKSGHRSLVWTLLMHGAKQLPDKDKDTPLHYAAKYGQEKVVKLFLENDIDDVDVDIKGSNGKTALHYAAESGHKDLVLTLLKHKAKHLPDGDKETPLHYAAIMGHEDIVKLFLESDVDVNIQGCNGMTALHHAVQANHIAIIVTLIKKGAHIDLKNDEDKTPLDLAQNQKDIIKRLLEKLVKN